MLPGRHRRRFRVVGSAMPWSVGDVDKHKSGLSQTEKEKWVRIANSVLNRCKKQGNIDCDARAIRIANSKVGGNASS